MWISNFIQQLRRRGRSLPLEFQDLCSVERLQAIINRERLRADRSGVKFSVLSFVPRDRSADQQTLITLATVFKRRLRCTDDAGWLGQRHLGVVLPDTDSTGAQRVASDVQSALTGVAPPKCEIYTYPTDFPNSPENRDERRNGHSRQDAAEAPIGSLEPFFVQPMTIAKRMLDVFGALVALAFFSPVMVAAALAIKLTSPGPIIYKQLRAGQGRQPFWMFKFRTMRTDADSIKQELMDRNEMDGPAFKIKNDPRITPIGRFLRRSSIDELPQLLHVLSGRMSLVGPRAMAWHESEESSTWQRRRLDVTPGLTGIWQVYGRARVSFDEWMRMDLQYVDTRSMRTDLKVLAATLPAVLSGEGAY
jgi:lipopolysaccharide/colanic/teichoic acid biosynthesis glycosyltransferase